MAVKKQSFMKGILVMMGAQVFIKLLGFIYRVVLTNFEEFADKGNSYYGSGYTVYMFILAIATMGIPNTISKIVSEKIALGDRRGAHRTFKVSFFLFAFIGAFFAALLYIFSEFFAVNILVNPGVELTMKVLAPAVFFVAISSTIRGYFVGMSNMTLVSGAQIIDQIVNCIFSIVFVVMLLDRTPEVMAAGSTMATTLAAFASMMYVFIYYLRNKKDIKEEVKLAPKKEAQRKRDIVSEVIRYVIPISFGSLVVQISNMIDLTTVLKGLTLKGYDIETANEIFGIILGKIDMLIALPLAFNIAFSTALVPAVSSAMARKDKKGALKKINFSIKLSSLIAFPCAIGMSVLAGPILQLIFPNAPNGAELLQISAFTIVFSVVAQTIYGSLHGIGKMVIPGICLLFGAAVKYFMNVTLIPIYGEKIAVASTLVYQLIAFTLATIILFYNLKEVPRLWNSFFKPGVISVIMGIVALITYNITMNITSSNSISTILAIIVAIIVYLLEIFIFKILNSEEIEQLPGGAKLNKLLKK